jgi:hypothetical protein
MTVENPQAIDFIGVDEKSGRVVLTVSDHLPWASDEHLFALQAKLNAYLALIESGELLELYGDAKHRQPEISVAFKYEPNEKGLEFIRQAAALIRGAGVAFTYSVVSQNGGSSKHNYQPNARKRKPAKKR